jgi:putative nucleotidyltransferase with HDIG domain
VNPVQRARVADDLVRRLAAAIRSAQLYSTGHPIVVRSVTALTDSLAVAHATTPSLAIGIVGEDLVVGDIPVPRAAENMGELLRRLQQAGVERIAIERGAEPTEITRLIQVLAAADPNQVPGLGTLRHIRVGRLQVEKRVDAPLGDMATFKRLYDDAVSVAEQLWDNTQAEGKPDSNAVRGIVDSLAQAVAQNRTALLALTALKNYDNYTFTHMVNVSILTMGQARGLGIDGALLREFGLAALMHDIGKVKTPTDILNKPDKLDAREFDIMKRHTIDGAEILRRTPDMPTLAPIVAFEHHLRLDGSGYPDGVKRGQLNLATMLCGVADVYDAMRSQRAYQQAFPTDRILAVLQRNDGKQFDQHLVRRFSQLVGMYPAGNLVRLRTGEIAVVTRPYAPDPCRPRVKVVRAADDVDLERPYEVNLWEAAIAETTSIERPVDPAAHGIDPLSHLQ